MQSKYTQYKNINMPSTVQLKLIQKDCGYGCVICGAPICYVYSQNDPFHYNKKFILLCPNHYPSENHLEKSNLFLKEKPYNIRNPQKTTDQIKIKLSNILLNQADQEVLIPILIDSLPVIAVTITESKPLLDILLFDEFNNELLIIRQNLIFNQEKEIAIEFKKNTFLIKNKSKPILLKIEFTKKMITIEGTILLSGVKVKIDNTSIKINEVQIKLPEIMDTTNHTIGISIGQNNDIPAVLTLTKVNRYNNH